MDWICMKNGSVVKKANHGIGIVRELGADTCVGSRCWVLDGVHCG